MADTNISLQITRIEEARDLIRNILGPTTGGWTGEFVDTGGKKTEWGPWGLGDGTEKIDELAEILSNIVNRGAPSLEVVEGKSIDLPRGFYMGGSIQGLSDISGDASKYKTQTKSATPSKSAITLSPDSGYYALSSVTIEPIPAKYQDVSATTAIAAYVLSGKKFTAADGTVITGTMKDNSGIDSLLIDNPTPSSITYPESGEAQKAILLEGFYPDTHVYIKTQQKAVTPSKSTQIVYPDADYWLGKVTVNPIPANYITTTDADAVAANILSGKTAYVNGSKITGTMANKSGTSSGFITMCDTYSYAGSGNTVYTGTETITHTIAAGYHDGASEVTLTLGKVTVTPTKSTQTINAPDDTAIGRVVVNPIPAEYITTTDATAVAPLIVSGYTAYVNGSKITGTMQDNGSAGVQILNATPSSITYTGGKARSSVSLNGYYNTAAAYIDVQEKSVTPTKSAQTIYPDTNYFLGKVTINAIPAAYQDVSATTASAATVLSGYKFTNTSGTVVTGTMANNGATNKTFNPLTETSVSIAAGYTTGGSVTLTADLENRLTAI